MNGTPKFLVLISYFGALHPTAGKTWPQHLAELDGHFAQLQAWGVDGVRIFPNWFLSFGSPYNDCDTVSDPNAVIRNVYGSWISPVGGQRLLEVLNLAAARGLVVDLTWTIEGVGPQANGTFSPMSKADYKLALGQVAAAMKGQFANVFFDIENEYEGNRCVGQAPNPKPPFSATGGAGSLQDIVAYLNTVDTNRIYTASASGNGGASQCLGAFPPQNAARRSIVQQEAFGAGFDVVSYHDPRNWYLDSRSYPYPTVACDTANIGHRPDWAYNTDDEVLGMIQEQNAYGVQKPIYFSEPERYLPSSYPNAVLTAPEIQAALSGAIAGGAAAWTFHTEGTFKLNGSGVTLYAPETTFLSTFRSAIGWP